MNRILVLEPITKSWKNKVAQYGNLWRLNRKEQGTFECKTWLMETAKPVHKGSQPYAKWGVYGVDFLVKELSNAK